MRDDPELTHAVIHSLNEWLHEEWSFNYEDRIFTTPVITLPIVEKAIEELEWAVERGAKTVLIRPAPVPCYGGSRSFALRGVRPVLAGRGRRRRAGVDARLRQRLLALPGRLDGPAGDAAVPARRLPHVHDGEAPDRGHDGRASTCHGLLTRFPDLRVASIENGGDWVVPFLDHLGGRPPQDAADVRRGPGRGVQAQRVRQPRSTRTTSRELVERHGRRPHPVRLRLPAPRGPGRAVQLRRPPARRAARGGRGQDHGRQPRRDHARPDRWPRPDVAGTSSSIAEGESRTWI